MPRTAQLSKSERARRLVPIFQNYGYEGATLNKLAKATELSKASLYHHYPKGKEDMAHHALAFMGQRLQKHILAPLNDKRKSPEDAIRGSLSGVLDYYNDAVPICLMNSMMLGEGKTLFGPQIKQTVDIWADMLQANLLRLQYSNKEAAELSKSIIKSIQGALIFCRIEASPTPLKHYIDQIETVIKRI